MFFFILLFINFVSSQQWTNITGLGYIDFINAMIPNGTDLYIGGNFAFAGNSMRNFMRY